MQAAVYACKMSCIDSVLMIRWSCRMEWMTGYSEVTRISVEYGRMPGSTREAARRLTFSIVRARVKSSHSDEA